jgi:hypothetical protein
MMDTIYLTDREYWFLLHQFGVESAAGFANPTRGMAAADVEDYATRALSLLDARGYVRKIGEDKFSMDEAVALRINAAAASQQTYTLTFEFPSLPPRIYVYYYNAPVFIRQHQSSPGFYELSVFEDHDDVGDLVVEQLAAHRSISADERDIIRLPWDDYSAAKDLYETGQPEGWQAHLEAAGINPDDIDKTKEMLDTWDIILTFGGIKTPGGKEQGAFHSIQFYLSPSAVTEVRAAAGEAGLWLAELAPTTVMDIVNRIDSVFKMVK